MPEWYGGGRERQGHDFEEACQRSVTKEIMFEEIPRGEERPSHVSFRERGLSADGAGMRVGVEKWKAEPSKIQCPMETF